MAEAGAVTDVEVAVVDVERGREGAVVLVELGVGDLEAVKVGGGRHGLGAGDESDGAGGVVGADRDEEGFGHGGDAAQLGDAAGADDVGHDVLGELLLEDGAELPAGVEALADADRDIGAGAELGESVGVLGWDGLFEPADAVGGDGVGEADRGGDVEAAVGVDEDLDAGADGLADGADDLDGVGFVGGVVAGAVLVEVGLVLAEGVELDGGVTFVDGLLGCAAEVVWSLAAGEPAVGVEEELLAVLAAEELVDGEAEALAAQVPQRDVDAADQGRDEAKRAEGAEGGVELVPEVLDAAGVLSY